MSAYPLMQAVYAKTAAGCAAWTAYAESAAMQMLGQNAPRLTGHSGGAGRRGANDDQ
jgi:hypothetical protein